MEVLNSYQSPSSRPRSSVTGSPYPSPRASSSASIFNNRSSRQSLSHHTELALPVDPAVIVEFDEKGPSSPLAVPRSARRSMSPRSFAPLTPIMASPITTPTTSMSSNALYLASSNEGAKEMLAALKNASFHEQDYLTKGILAPIPSSTTTAVLVKDTSSPWTSPPTPPPKSERSAVDSDSQRVSSSWEPPAASLQASLNAHAVWNNERRRRASLPIITMSKPLPPTPPPPPSPSLKTQVIYRPRQTSRLSAGPLEDSADVSEGGAARRKRKFHVPDDSSDREDEGFREPWTESPIEIEGTHAEASSSDHNPDNGWSTDKCKDDIRRYHVLMELLSTEVGYLMDLRELVNGYIRQLPTLSCRPSASTSHFGSSSNLSISPFTRSPTSSTFPTASLSSASRTNSHSQLSPTGRSFSATPAEPTASIPAKDKSATQYMFADEEVDAVTRNIEEILQFHEQFVEELRASLKPHGFTMTAVADVADTMQFRQKKGIGPIDRNLEAAITIVSKKFATQASYFESYETFCSGHSEAFDIIRKIQHEHTVEWDAFEQQSSNLVADMRKPTLRTQTVEGPVSSLPEGDDGTDALEAHRRRRHSLSSLDAPTRTLRARPNANLKHTATIPGNTGAGRDKSSRLVFADYLIKPVQRICKYPLLLDQLKTRKNWRISTQVEGSGSGSSSAESSSPADTNTFVESASQAMKDAASSVDEARRRQDISTKSSLIAKRIQIAFSAQSSSSLRSLVGHNISPVFLSSLGATLLAGSMDVIHHYADKIPGTSGTVKAKYYGAFLYMGGYFILVKVCKGQVYEPRHWFPLAAFELFDVPEEDALLPCSFRLSSKGHHFDMAVACPREKDVWISAFRESLTLRPSWINEPVSSLHAGDRNDFTSVQQPSPSEGIPPVPPLPAIQPIPERPAPAVVRTDTGLLRGSICPDNSSRQDSSNLSVTPSRRSSTASVKAIFLPVSESTILIRRASPTARQHVERGLLDVFSDLCLSARLHANTHEEELFQAPKVTRSGFSRSSSGLGMTGMGVAAKNRLTKRESVLVQRRKSGVDGYVVPSEGDNPIGPLKRASTTKSLANRRHAKKLKIVSVPMTLTSDGEGELLPDSPPALSQCSSVTASNTGSVNGSPTIESKPLRVMPVKYLCPTPRSLGRA